MLVAQPCTEDLGLMSPLSVETSPNMGATCLESLPLVGASPAGSPSSPRDLPEPRVTTEHTNNRIGESACLGSLVWSGLRGPWAPNRNQRPWVQKAPQGRGMDSPISPRKQEMLFVKALSCAGCSVQPGGGRSGADFPGQCARELLRYSPAVDSWDGWRGGAPPACCHYY